MSIRFKLQFIGWWTIIQGIVILFLVGWLMCLSLANYSFNANSSAGVIVAVLGILVTLLVGFQIYNAIEIKRELHQQNIKIIRHEHRFNEMFKSFEFRLNEEIQSLEEKLRENRYLADSNILLKRTLDWEKWNDPINQYLETGQLIKYLVLSNIKRYGIIEERYILEDCFWTLDGIIERFEKEPHKERVQLFNSNAAMFDRINNELATLFTEDICEHSDSYLNELSDLQERRHKLLSKYGEYSKNKT